jgi:hypothetical protein
MKYPLVKRGKMYLKNGDKWYKDLRVYLRRFYTEKITEPFEGNCQYYLREGDKFTVDLSSTYLSSLAISVHVVERGVWHEDGSLHLAEVRREDVDYKGFLRFVERVRDFLKVYDIKHRDPAYRRDMGGLFVDIPLEDSYFDTEALGMKIYYGDPERVNLD